MRDSHTKLTLQSILLHWLVAIGIILMLAMGFYMDIAEARFLMPWHKSFGVLILLFALWRIVWRMINGWPTALSNEAPAVKLVSKGIHWLLIIGSALMPLSGIIMSGFGGKGLFFFGLEVWARNPDPMNPGQTLAVNEMLSGIGHELHEIGAYVMVLAIVLHIAGAMKQHHILKNGTVKRMLGKTID